MNTSVDETTMLKELEFDPDGPSEKTISIFHPIHAYSASGAATESIKEALARFTTGEIVSGRGDAFRHALWSYKLSRMMGPDLAKKFSDAHEVSEVNSGEDRLMDLFNNRVGRLLAADPKNHGRKDEEVVMDALRRGELQTMPIAIAPGTTISPSNVPKSSRF